MTDLLERDFAFGVARQLFERRCADATADERDALFAGPARPVATLFQGDASSSTAQDTGFAILHGLYWLTVNLADHAPLLLAVDDAHWADERRCAGSPTWRPASMGRPFRSSRRCARTSPRRRARAFNARTFVDECVYGSTSSVTPAQRITRR